MTSSRRYQQGQSAIIFAILIVVIVGMIGLSVDGGNVYAEQRRVQSITNAGALAGMQAAQAPNATNDQVWNSVKRALYANRVEVEGELYAYRVDYVLTDGSVELLGEWDGNNTNVPLAGNTRPNNIDRVQVTMTETVPTYFASIVGRNTLSVSANGVSCVGNFGPGVYPLGIPLNLRKEIPAKNNKPAQQYHRIYKSNGGELLPSEADWGKWDKMQGMSIELPLENYTEDMSGTHMSWLSWSGNNGADELKDALTYPGTLQDGFVEATPFDASQPNTEPARQLSLGDWVNGDTGVKATVDGELNKLKTDKRDLILPIYEQAGKFQGNGPEKTVFRVVKMGRFRMVDASLQSGDKYIKVQYLGEAAPSPVECGSEAPANIAGASTSPTTPNASVTPGASATPATPGASATPATPGASAAPKAERYRIEGTVQVDRAWRKTISSSSYTNDIVLVMDTSGSMAWDWNDRDTGSQNQRLNDAKRVLKEFISDYDTSQATGDPDARIALVTFGGSRDEHNLNISATNWTSAQDWGRLQTQIDGLRPNGHTPGPLGFEEVENLLRPNRKRSVPSNKVYNQVVVFATDGVFNVCGGEPTPRNTPRCDSGKIVPNDGSGGNNYLNNAQYNMVQGRPIWQAQQVANRIKALGAKLFVVALTPTCPAGSSTCFNPAGLPEMSSGSGYYYQANSDQALTQIYSNVRGAIVTTSCTALEERQLAAGATVTLTKPGNPTWKMEATTDNNGNFRFTEEVEAGEYVVTAAPLNITSSEDGKQRTYSRVRNARDLSEEGQASVHITSELRNNAPVVPQLLLSLPTTADGTPHNGCTMPKQ